MKEHETQTPVATLWLEDGIIHLVHTPDAEVTLEDARELLESIKKMVGPKRHPALADLRAMKAVTGDARQYFSGPEFRKVQTATALLIGSPVSRVIGNFYMGLNRPVGPTKLFTREEEALAWLRQYFE